MTSRRPSRMSSAASRSSSASTRIERSSSTGTNTRSAHDRSDRRRPPYTERAPLGAPLLLLNLKTFPTILGERSLRIAEALERAGRSAGVAVAIAPPAPELARVASGVRIPVISQHVDPIEPGSSTGFVPVAALAPAGARGSLVNHSEHPLRPPAIRTVVRQLADARLAAVVCARDAGVAGRLARLRPPYLAVEPPELIGGRRSVSTARPEVVASTVATVRAAATGTRVLCGAGVHDRRDVRRAIELGSAGVLVASAVARAARPRAAIEELLAGF